MFALVAAGCEEQTQRGAPKPASNQAENAPAILERCTEPIADPITISADFNASPSVRYKLRKNRWTQSTAGDRHVAVGFEVTVECTWREDVLEVKWQQRITDAPPEVQDPVSPEGRLASLAGDVEYTTTIDQNGKLGAIENIDEILARRDEMLDVLEASLKQAMPPDEAEQVLRTTRDSMTSQILEASLLADLARLLVPYGLELTADAKIKWNEPVALPIGGILVESEMTVTAVGIDPDTGAVGIRQVRHIDPDLLNDAVRGSLTSMAQSMGRQAPDMMSTVEMTFEAEFLQDPGSPWPLQAVFEQSANSGDSGRRERWHWTRLPD